MYTPRGELNETLLRALYQDGVLDALKLCRDRIQLLKSLEKYVAAISEEELTESLTIVQSYLEEEQEIRLLNDQELDEVAGGAQKKRIFQRDRIVGLLEKNPEAARDLLGIFTVLRK